MLEERLVLSLLKEATKHLVIGGGKTPCLSPYYKKLIPSLIRKGRVGLL